MIFLILAGLFGFYYATKKETRTPIAGVDYNDVTAVKENANHVPGILRTAQQNVRKGTNPAVQIRAPYGPSRTELQVQTVDQVKRPAYQMTYRKQLYNAQIKNQHPLLDITYNSVLNDMSGTQPVPIDGMLSNIYNFQKSNRRKLQT